MERKKNDGDLFLWAMGWIAKQYRGDETYTAIARRIGQTGTGYKRMETGTSGNFRTWCELFETYDKDIVAVLSMCRVIVRDIQDAEQDEGRPLEPDERELIANDVAKILKL